LWLFWSNKKVWPDRRIGIGENTTDQRLQELNQFWQHKNHVVDCLVRLYGKAIKDDHIMQIHNFLIKFYDKINLQSLELDLEKYRSTKIHHSQQAEKEGFFKVRS